MPSFVLLNQNTTCLFSGHCVVKKLLSISTNVLKSDENITKICEIVSLFHI